eukprot:10703746-Lingulodinium_polyedra.AAC.1
MNSNTADGTGTKDAGNCPYNSFSCAPPPAQIVALAPTDLQLVLLGPGLDVLAVVDLLAELDLLPVV